MTLDHPWAVEPALTGAKAAALAQAAKAGLPVLPGAVLTTAATAGPAAAGLREAWQHLSEDGRRRLVVRSSSTAEDGRTSSMAGVFTSVLDVRGWNQFVSAVATVLGSRKTVPGIECAPMAVLVQPQLEARVGGVLFGADPVSGRRDRIIVAADSSPDRVVGGASEAAHYLLSPRGRRLEADRLVPGLGAPELRALARLAARAAKIFGGPQDIEWAFDAAGKLHLLQSRPITTPVATAEGRGPVLGPGPVAETFPDPLSELEADLWVHPLRTALCEAVVLTGAAARRRVTSSPVVTTVGGRVAADLALLDAAPVPPRLLARLDPRPPARRLRASWRVGRLRAALPALARDLLAEVDRQLLEVPHPEDLSDGQLMGLLETSRQMLVALHGHEVLAGLLVAPGASGATAASMALQALAEGRRSGLAEEEIVVAHPVVLALVAPKVPPAVSLPQVAGGSDRTPEQPPADPTAVLREALRLRARWVQELSSRAASELGARLERRGLLSEAALVRHLRLRELGAAVDGSVPEDVAQRSLRPETAPLPAAFRLGEDADVVVELRSRTGRGAGQGAGGGRGRGRVHHGEGLPPAGAVLVVQTLDPGLATVLPHLGGLVAETGSVLSHLAILAREFGVPTVVGVPDAVRRFAPGSEVVVDGTTGEVTFPATVGASR